MPQKLLAKTIDETGTLTVASEPLGRGGEGSVFEVLSIDVPGFDDPNALVAKIYHDAGDRERYLKIKSMLSNPPSSDAIAWPLVALFNTNKLFVGFIMKKLDNDSYRAWLEFSNTKQRQKTSPNFDVRYGVMAARNFAASMLSVHNAGHIIGDVNESNVFVSRTSETFIVDADSCQITDGDKFFPCTVGKPEYTAPELSHGSLRDQKRTPQSDVYAFAVMLHQIITGGAHPTDGKYLGSGDPPTRIERMRNAWFPGLRPGYSGDLAPVSRIPTKAIPLTLQKLLINCLLVDPRNRPSINSIITLLDKIIDELVQCDVNKYHWFIESEGCGWCEQVRKGQLDVWGDASNPVENISQRALPEVGFNNGDDENVQATRVPVRKPSQNFGKTGYSGVGSQTQPGSPAPSPGSNQPGQQSSQSNPSQQKSLPSKHKGKTILTFADGSRQVRPPLLALARSNPRIALQCLLNETPGPIAPVWLPSRPVAQNRALWMGSVVSMIMGVAWFLIISSIPDWYVFNQSWINPLWGIFASIALVATIISGVSLTMSGLRDRSRTRKHHGSLDNLVVESESKTISRFLVLSLFYGPGSIAIVCSLALAAALSFISSIIDAATGPRRRF